MTAAARGRRRIQLPARLRGFSPRRMLVALTPGPRLRRRVALAALIAGLLAGLYFVWLRDSGLVAVDDVMITGATGRDAADIRAALERSAMDMTTLHVDRGDLERTVAGFPTVRALKVSPDFPHKLEIRVLEHRPVAIVVAEGKRVPVAGDGSVLSGVPVKGSLPEIETRQPIAEHDLAPGLARDAARVAGGAPAVLTSRLESVESRGAKGIVVTLADDGPELIFGEPTEVRRKWTAAVRLLADRDAVGATYIDVSLPGRPVAGGLPVKTVAPIASAGAQDEAAKAGVVTAPQAPVAPQSTAPGATAAPPTTDTQP